MGRPVRVLFLIEIVLLLFWFCSFGRSFVLSLCFSFWLATAVFPSPTTLLIQPPHPIHSPPTKQNTDTAMHPSTLNTSTLLRKHPRLLLLRLSL